MSTTTLHEPISRRALHDELADRIRQMIVEGEIACGARVPEQALSEQFGVSRTPIREALKVLASEGLVVLVPNRGATVFELRRSDLEDLFPVMGALEALAGELACEKLTDQDFDKIHALHRQMVAEYEAGDLKAYFRTNEAIHAAIHSAAANETLMQTIQGLSGRVRRARYQANMTPERWAQAIDEHQEMLDAMASRDGAALGELLREHLQNKLESVLATLDA